MQAHGLLPQMANSPQILSIGSVAPGFSYQAVDGTTQHTDDLKGTPWVVYFYPKDDTPGCTKEACSFRDAFAQFKARGVTVIGVSPDSEKSHAKFREKFTLPFAMAADTDKQIVQAYGVWGEKKFMGRTYMGAHRVTFVVGADGRIAKVFDKVKPEGHAAEVLAALEGI